MKNILTGFKNATLGSSVNVCLKKNAKQTIWLHIKEYAFVNSTWRNCQLRIDSKHWKCKIFKIGVNCFIWQNFISERSPTRNPRSIKCVPWTLLVIEKKHSFWLAGLWYGKFAVLTLICMYPFIRWLKISITSLSLAVQLEFKSWLKKPLHYDIIRA